MFCPECGKEIANDSVFCEHCGKKIAEEVTPNVQQGTNFTAPQTAPAKPMNKKTVILIAVIAICAVVGIVLALTHKHTIDLSEYTKVEFNGCDGYGTAYVQFDSAALLEEAAKYDKELAKKSKSISDSDSLSELFGELVDSAVDTYSYLNIKTSLDKDSKLKNGDKVTVTLKFDNEEAKKHGIKFKCEKIEKKVSGLSDCTAVNPFDYITVKFEGMAPNATAYIEKSGEDYISDTSFSLDKDSGISLGDTITVTIDDSQAQYLAEQYGVAYTETSKTYTCDSVSSYIGSSADITDDFLGQIQGQTKDVIEAYFAGESDQLKMSGLGYCGYYLLVNKSNDGYSTNNYLYIIYNATVSSKEGDFKKKTVYLPVCYTNIVKNADGSLYCDDFTNGQIVNGNTDLEYDWFSEVKGYTKKAEMQNDLVTANKANYNCEIIGDVLN